MSLLTKQDTLALLIIDVQKGLYELEFYGGERNNPDAEINMRILLDHWRLHKLPVFHIKHNSKNPASPLYKGNPGNEIKEIVKPLAGELVFEKNVNSAFIGTGLLQQLKLDKIRDLVIIGLTIEHCISTSVRMASNLGFNTILVSDATAAFNKIGKDGKIYPATLVYEISLANLDQEFATIFTTNELLNHMHETDQTDDN